MELIVQMEKVWQTCILHRAVRSSLGLGAGGWYFRLTLHAGGTVQSLPSRFHDPVVLLCFQLETDRVWRELQNGGLRLWNRQYVDYFFHITGSYNFSELEKSTMRCFGLPRFASMTLATALFSVCPQHQSLHPRTHHFRFTHLYLGRGWNFTLAREEDWLVDQLLVLRSRRAKL